MKNNKISPYLFVFFIIIFIIIAGPLNIEAADIQDNIPFSTTIALERAQKLIQEHKLSQAIDLLENFKKDLDNKKKGGHPFLFFTLGNYYMEENNMNAACISYEAAVQTAADFSPAWLNLARANYELGHFNRAGECFIRGYDLEKEKRPVLLYYAANAFFSAKLYQRAMEVFNTLLKDHINEIEPRWQELPVHIFLELKQPEKALPHMEFLAKKLDGKVQTQWQETLLYHYMSLGMDKKAMDLVSFLTTQYPMEPRWWKGLARFNLEKNDFKNALVAMTIYSFLTPLTMDEKKLMADLYLEAGIPARALDLYQELSGSEKKPEMIKRAVLALEQMNLYEKALEILEHAIKKHENSLELNLIKGNILFALELYKRAAELFENIAEDDDSGRSWLMLGYSRWNTGEMEAARKAMKKAVIFKDQKKAAARALKTLRGQI